MEPFHEYIDEYRKQLARGEVQKAYRGLLEYILGLRVHFSKKYPNYSVSGSIYYGYMDMSYFSIFPEPLKNRDLKIALVFIHQACRFEIWLAGKNKQVQQNYWKLFRESNWNMYQIVSTTKDADSIVEHILVDQPDFKDLAALTLQIEDRTMKFIEAVEAFLSSHTA